MEWGVSWSTYAADLKQEHKYVNTEGFRVAERPHLVVLWGDALQWMRINIGLIADILCHVFVQLDN